MIDLTSNRISHMMSAEQLTAIKTALQQVTKNLDFLVKLSSEEAEAFYNISDADKTFIRNCVTEMNNAGDILPPYVKPEEITTDLTCGDQLLEVENALAELLDHVRLNRRLANYEAYSGASVFYRLVGAASRSGSASARAMHERLASYHKQRSRRKSSDNAAQN